MKKMLLGMCVLFSMALVANAAFTFSADKTEYQLGETITVSWENSDGTWWDWIGIYGQDDQIPAVGSTYWEWCPDGITTGSMLFEMPKDGRGTLLNGENLPVGDWVVHFFLNDSYDIAGSHNFTVVPEPATILLTGLGALGLIRRRRNK